MTVLPIIEPSTMPSIVMSENDDGRSASLNSNRALDIPFALATRMKFSLSVITRSLRRMRMNIAISSRLIVIAGRIA